MSSPLFSIITVVRNGAATIRRTIDSVHAQSFQDYEYIVVDGASTDGTVELLQKEQNKITTWKSETDKGIYDAFNKALALAKGTWIAFLGADDVYCEDALAVYYKAINDPRNAGIQYVSSQVHLVRNGRTIRTIGSQWSWPKFSKYMTVAHVGSMHNIELFRRFGLFDTSYRICGDYEFLLRPGRSLRAAFIPRVTAQMTVRGTSDSGFSLPLREQERAKRSTGGRSTTLCTLERRTAYVKTILRRLVWY